MEYLEVNPSKNLKALLPFQEKFTNPAGIFQGGILCAALDEVFGPLSYISAQAPCMTLALHTTFLAPFKREMKTCQIEGMILKQSKNFIFMRAEIHSPDQILLAHAESHVKIL
jgi:acyl-coenzyme A thioesterase PaaI-like protein